MLKKLFQLVGLIIVIILLLIPLGFAVDEINSATDMYYAEFTTE